MADPEPALMVSPEALGFDRRPQLPVAGALPADALPVAAEMMEERLSGELLKRGKYLKSSWNLRHVILYSPRVGIRAAPASLRYFQNQEHAPHHWKEDIVLHPSSTEVRWKTDPRVNPHGPQMFTFAVTTSQGVFCFRSENASTAETWAVEIARACSASVIPCKAQPVAKWRGGKEKEQDHEWRALQAESMCRVCGTVSKRWCALCDDCPHCYALDPWPCPGRPDDPDEVAASAAAAEEEGQEEAENGDGVAGSSGDRGTGTAAVPNTDATWGGLGRLPPHAAGVGDTSVGDQVVPFDD